MKPAAVKKEPKTPVNTAVVKKEPVKPAMVKKEHKVASVKKESGTSASEDDVPLVGSGAPVLENASGSGLLAPNLTVTAFLS